MHHTAQVPHCNHCQYNFLSGMASNSPFMYMVKKLLKGLPADGGEEVELGRGGGPRRPQGAEAARRELPPQPAQYCQLPAGGLSLFSRRSFIWRPFILTPFLDKYVHPPFLQRAKAGDSIPGITEAHITRYLPHCSLLHHFFQGQMTSLT